MYERTFAPPGRATIAGSARLPLTNTKDAGEVDQGHEMTVTVYVRRRPDAPEAMPPETLGAIPPQWRSRPDDDAILAAFSAAPEDIAAVEKFAGEHNLKVVESNAARRSVLLQGTAGDFGKAFGTKLSRFQRADGLRYRGRSGPLTVPTELAPLVDAVFGLDNRPMGRSYLKRRKPIISHAQPPRNTYLPPQVAQLYNFPPGTDGSGQCIAIFAFNGQLGDTGETALGGYDPAAIKAYFEQVLGIPAPQITNVVVHGPGNQPGDGTQDTDATGEVLLDIQVAGGVAPSAKLVMYFTEFTEQGWVDAITAAATDTVNKPSIISISYGNPEDASSRSLWTKSAILKTNEAFHVAALRHITICCASGDDGSNDQVGDGLAHCDFPSSSPYVLGVGGTRLESTNGIVVGESTWNDGPGSATGGGVSHLFAKPSYQTTVTVPVSVNPGHRAGRGVPDVSAVGDPDTGYMIVGPSGQLDGPIGGTSASAPLWAGLIARINQALGVPVGYFNPILYKFLASGVLRDVVKGNNFSYAAGQGYDVCTGLGTPDGVRLLTALHQLGQQPAVKVLAAPAAVDPVANIAAAVSALITALQQAGIPIR